MFVIKKGDTAPAIQGSLTTRSNLEGASAIFIMRNADNELVIFETANITSIEGKTIVYQWAEGETDIAGKYQAEFRITYADGRVETFPNVGFITIYIEENIEED